MTINWNYVGHAIVGTVVTACQAVALADPGSSTVQMACKVISIVAVNLGVTFGVWQTTQLMGARRSLLALQKPSLPEPSEPTEAA